LREEVMVFKRKAFLIGVVWLASAGFASAEHPPERHGFWLGIGGGYGSADATCDDCGSGDRQNGAVGYFKLGGTLNESVLLGAEFNVWTKEQEGVRVNFYNASGTLTLYPVSSAGFFLKGGVGASFVDTEVRDGNVRISTDLGSGFGLLGGAGYDVRVARNISITPSVDFWWGQPGDLKVGGETLATNWKQNVIDVTIGVTFH
jgi:hypothetical protein